MNGVVVVALTAALAVPVFLLILWLDTKLTEKEYNRRIRGDETARYARARAAVARQQATSNVRIGHHDHTDPNRPE